MRLRTPSPRTQLRTGRLHRPARKPTLLIGLPISALLIVLACAILVGWAAPRPVKAQDAGPAVIRDEALVDFPETVTFRLELAPGAEVRDAVLTYSLGRTSCIPAGTQVPVEADGDVLEWTWIMSRSGNPPPGAEMWWSWTVTNAAGQTLTTPRQKLTFRDDRFAWRTVEAAVPDGEGRVLLNWHEGEQVGPVLLAAATAGLERLQADMGITLNGDVQFFIYGSAEEVRQAVLNVQDWAAGLAFSDYNIILIGVPPSQADNWGARTVRHELAHLVIGRFGYSCLGGGRPTWLNEGLAVYAEGEPDSITLSDIANGLEENAFIPVRSLNGAFPAHEDTASMAYSQSYSLVDFLLREFGQEKMQALLLALAEAQGYDDALEHVYGFNVDGLEVRWREAIGARPRTIPATPTPILAASVPTVVPLDASGLSVPTPAPGATADASNLPAGDDRGPGVCGLGLIPLVLLIGLAFARPVRRRENPQRGSPPFSFGWVGTGFFAAKSRAKKLRHAVLPGLLLVLLASGCGLINLMTGEEDPADLYNLDRENTLFLVGGQPRTLDPATTRGGSDGPIGAIFSGLVQLDTNLQVQPELAAGWEVDPTGTVYTFALRPEALFHDGRPVTAADVIFSWERAADSATASDTVQTYLGDIVGLSEKLSGAAPTIAGLRAPDDHTLEVRIDAPKPYFLSKLTYPVAFVVDQANVSEPDWERAPNGTGPFTLEEWRDDEVLILARSERYYLGQPAVGHVVYLMGAGIPLNMYEKDQIDLVGVGGSTLERVQDPNDPLFPDLRLGVDMCTQFVGFNTAGPPFDDPLVRRAFSLALDRERLIDGPYRGNALLAAGPLPPGMPGYTGDLPASPYDPEAARGFLTQAGYSDPAAFPPVTYVTSGYGGVGTFATAVITMWQEALGVTVEPLLVDPFLYFDELYAGRTENIFSYGWCADYPDPENFLDVLFHSGSRQNLGDYANPTVDALLEEARSEPDVATRLALYADAERLIVQDAPAVFITHSLSAVLVKPRLQNFVLTPLGVPQWHRVSLLPG